MTKNINNLYYQLLFEKQNFKYQKKKRLNPPHTLLNSSRKLPWQERGFFYDGEYYDIDIDTKRLFDGENIKDVIDDAIDEVNERNEKLHDKIHENDSFWETMSDFLFG